ncbi:MAG TPA: glycoside hydrolase family 16 protein [Gaiellaceae bacterium]
MRYELEFEDTFAGDELDLDRWLPYYLPHWSSRALSAAHYRVGDGLLELLIEGDQQPWCPEFDDGVRVSSLQTGEFAGPLGSRVGQHRFKSEARVREEQKDLRLYTPHLGRVELRAAASDDPSTMVSLWMIGYEDEAERSAEICVCEIFGRDVGPREAGIGLGVHPFGDPSIADEFSRVFLPMDARDFHVYAAEWRKDEVVFFVDDEEVKSVSQSPSYPMQLMLGIYEFPDASPQLRPDSYPKRFAVDFVRGYQLLEE